MRVDDAEASRIESILSKSSVNINDRRDDYRADGWNKFDEQANKDAIRKARETTPMI